VKDLQNYLGSIDVVDAARSLLGCELERTVDGERTIVRIVETEAYHQSDAASHSYRGKTPRTDVMFGSAGRLYVYFTYGMHYCCNVVTGPEEEGSAVLIRAVEPIENTTLLQLGRGKTGVELTNGPAKLCQALQIDTNFNGHDLAHAPIRLHIKPPLAPAGIVATTRIGITNDTERPWRFYIKDNPYVSKRAV
jgi:DNA-3-methyladenine glycosylase